MPGVQGPGYGMARLIDRSDYCRDVLQALGDEGIEVDQIHPEYAAGQLEISLAAESPVDAADTTVLARSTIRAVGRRHGLRTSFSPKVAVPGVENGGHVHLSLWRDNASLMSGGAGPSGFAPEARGVQRRDPGATTGVAGRGRAESGELPATGAVALGRGLRLLGRGEPRGGDAPRTRVGRQ